jgi:hypothetical protein
VLELRLPSGFAIVNYNNWQPKLLTIHIDLSFIGRVLRKEFCMNITGTQVRAARAILRWTIAELAAAASVGISTVQEIERADGVPMVSGELQWRVDARAEAVEKVQRALEAAGATFLPANSQGEGVRYKSSS